MWNWNWEWNSEWITEWYFITNVSKSKPSKSCFMTCNFSTVCSEAFESLWSCCFEKHLPTRVSRTKHLSQIPVFSTEWLHSCWLWIWRNDAHIVALARSLCSSVLFFALLSAPCDAPYVCRMPSKLSEFQNLTWPRTDYLGIIESYQIILNHLHPNATKQGRQNRWNCEVNSASRCWLSHRGINGDRASSNQLVDLRMQLSCQSGIWHWNVEGFGKRCKRRKQCRLHPMHWEVTKHVFMRCLCNWLMKIPLRVFQWTAHEISWMTLFNLHQDDVNTCFALLLRRWEVVLSAVLVLVPHKHKQPENEWTWYLHAK